MLPGAAPVAAVVGGVVKGIGAFVKYLVSYAAKGDDVPGLKAMVPGGAFVKEINKTQQGQPGPGTNWYVVSSNFHVKLFDDSHNPPEFPRELVVKLGEGFVDKLFEGPNDLVVDVSSMDAIDAKVGGFVREVLALGENDTVYHTNYFSQLRVIEALAGWLPPVRRLPPHVLTGHPNHQPEAPRQGRLHPMARYALCVGINEFKSLPRSSWLSGCVNDANDISKALKKSGFTARNVKVLTDKQATKKNVMAALEEMVAKAKPGDHVVFTFSSHGTQVPSQPGDTDEPDNLDEAFTCYDLKQGGEDWDRKTVILDDELR